MFGVIFVPMQIDLDQCLENNGGALAFVKYETRPGQCPVLTAL